MTLKGGKHLAISENIFGRHNLKGAKGGVLLASDR